MNVTIKEFDGLRAITIPDICGNGNFCLKHNGGLPGIITKCMIKYFGETIKVEKDINPDTYIFKEPITSDKWIEIKIRGWMVK